MNPDLFIGIVVTLLGLVMGSGMTALSWRVPRGQSWVTGRSKCPGCGWSCGPARPGAGAVLGALGRALPALQAGVSARYPLIELTCGAWALLAWLKMS